jgi:diguanylate cyclase (GGDEF)-like protein/PAS domain S-box-containing protein
MSLANRSPGLASPEVDDSVYRLLIDNAVDVIVLVSTDLRRLYVSPACLEIMGYTSDDLLGRKPVSIIHPEDLDRVMCVLQGLTAEHTTDSTEWRMIRSNGDYRWMETTYRRLPDGRLVGVIRDIQARKEMEQQLQEALRQVEHLAMHDPLTDLPNRRYFIETVDRRLAGAAVGQRHAMLLVDLDRFKPVNDLYGHNAGDAVLVEVSRRLQACCGEDAFVARLGGDEFAALLDADNLPKVHRTSHAIVETVSAPICIDHSIVTLGASIGIATTPEDGTETAALLRQADAAMYRCKHARSGGCRAKL